MTNANLASLFFDYYGVAPEKSTALAPSGSSRRYYRLSAGEGQSCVGVEGDDVAENRAFCYLSSHFLSKGLNVPEVYGVSEDGRCYIQEDLGDKSLFSAVSEGRSRAIAAFQSGGPATGATSSGVSADGTSLDGVFSGGASSGGASSGGVFSGRASSGGVIYSEEETELLCRTISRLPDFQFLGADGLDFSRCHPTPAMDSRSVMFDLNYFKYCYLLNSGIEFSEVRLQDEFEAFARDLLSEPFDTFMYRDFQSRNVMIARGEPYFIDFQSGRRGPIYYDLASFVYQARSCFPAALKERMIASYLEAAGKYISIDREAFALRLRTFVLFRTMQVLGAYGFRGLVQKKQHFVESIPFALGNLRELLREPFERYPYLTDLLRSLADSAPDVRTSVDPTPALSSAPEPGTPVGSAPEVTCPGHAPDVGKVPAVAVPPAALSTDPVMVASTSSAPAAAKSAGEAAVLTVSVTSFSYKEGLPGDDSGNGGGYIFDCRGLNNPGRYPRYRHSTGRDADVIEFLENDGGIFPFLDNVYALVDPHVDNFLSRGFTHLSVSFGCTGGHHRSVYCAEHMAVHLTEKYGDRVSVGLTHRELQSLACGSAVAGGDLQEQQCSSSAFGQSAGNEMKVQQCSPSAFGQSAGNEMKVQQCSPSAFGQSAGNEMKVQHCSPSAFGQNNQREETK